MNERDFACYKAVRETVTCSGGTIFIDSMPKVSGSTSALGHILAIELESGDYVLGKDELKVALKAVKKFPGEKFSFFRIGYPAVHKLRLKICLKVG